MRRELTYATVCSGIECCSVACRGLPLKPVFFSEIEPYPCAVLKAHYPDVPNLGDMSKIQVNNQTEITNGTVRLVLERPLDILAGGTPCQDISQAGKQRGMAQGSNTRSSLAFDFVRLARELRPKYVIWENVGATISSKIAGDFLRFMSALDDCGYSLAWRVLDAQYVRVDGMERAVPQRRRRVWVVGCLGADESVPAQILFEPDCVAGHTPPRRRTGQGFAYSLARCDRVDARLVGGAPGVDVLNFQGSKGNNCVTSDGSCPNLNAMHGHDVHVVALDGDKLKPREDQRKGGNGFGVNEEGAGYTLTAVDRHGVAYGINNQGGAAPQFTDETSGTMVAASNSSGNNLHGVAYENDHLNRCEVARSLNGDHDDRVTDSGTSVVHVATAYKLDSTASNSMKSANPNSGFHETQVAACLDTTSPDPTKNQGGNVIVSTNSNGEDVAPTISSCEYKMGQKQKDTSGGYIVTRQEGADGE